MGEATARNQEKESIGNPIVNPIGNPIVNPIGNPIVNPIGNAIVNPIGNPIVNPIGNPIVNPIGNPIVYGNPIGNPIGNATNFWLSASHGRMLGAIRTSDVSPGTWSFEPSILVCSVASMLIKRS